MNKRYINITKEMELTEKQLDRQDFMDNATSDFINSLIPNGKLINWDIESIGQVRDAVCNVLVVKQFCSEQDFYPYIPE